MAEAGVYRSGQAAYPGPLVRVPKKSYAGMSAEQLAAKAGVERMVAHLELIRQRKMLGLYSTAYRLHAQTVGHVVREELKTLIHEARLETFRLRQKVLYHEEKQAKWLMEAAKPV